MPVKMRKDSLEAGANYVHITYDEQGNEILYEYMDEQGYRAKNKDGAYMTKKEYDKDGLQIKEASCNAIGNYMIDDYGNCLAGTRNMIKTDSKQVHVITIIIGNRYVYQQAKATITLKASIHTMNTAG